MCLYRQCDILLLGQRTFLYRVSSGKNYVAMVRKQKQILDFNYFKLILNFSNFMHCRCKSLFMQMESESFDSFTCVLAHPDCFLK